MNILGMNKDDLRDILKMSVELDINENMIPCTVCANGRCPYRGSTRSGLQCYSPDPENGMYIVDGIAVRDILDKHTGKKAQTA